MKIEKKEVTVYIAEDGKECLNKHECKNYEDTLKIKKARKEFLSETILNEIKKRPDLIDDWIKDKQGVLNNLYLIAEETNTEIGYVIKDEKIEFDEDCPFDISKWHEFEKEIFIKYGYKINDSIYYWSK